MNRERALQSIPYLAKLSVADRDWIIGRGEIRVLARGERVWDAGNQTTGFAFLVRGQVKLVKSGARGREVITELGRSGDLLCSNAVWMYAPYCCSAVALEDDTEVVIVPRRDVLEINERSTRAGQVFLEQVINRSMALCRRIDQLASGQVETRIATLFLTLAERGGIDREDGTWLPVPLSRQDLADLCGTTIETAIRAMSRFGRDGIVRTTARGFLILDPRKLERVASPS